MAKTILMYIKVNDILFLQAEPNLGWAELVYIVFSLGWVELVRFILVWAELSWAKLGWQLKLKKNKVQFYVEKNKLQQH